MSIDNYPRLLAAAKEFNLNQNELINILVKNGFNRDDLKPTFKLSKEMYEVLQRNCTENKEIIHDKAKPKRIDF
jgi:translation initiation factor IF-2